MRFLRRFGDLLDVADEKATEADLHSLTKEVAGSALEAAGGALEAAAGEAADRVKTLDLGLRDGWSELASQIGTDLKDAVGGGSRPAESRRLLGHNNLLAAVGSSPAPTSSSDTAAAAAAAAVDTGTAGGSSRQLPQHRAVEQVVCKTAEKLSVLQERVQELELREADRLHARRALQLRFEDIDAELRSAQEARCTPPATDVHSSDAANQVVACGGEGGGLDDSSALQAGLDAMRREFVKRQSAAGAQLAALEAEVARARTACEPLAVELDFWKGKAEHMMLQMRSRQGGAGGGGAGLPPPAEEEEEEEEHGVVGGGAARAALTSSSAGPRAAGLGRAALPGKEEEEEEVCKKLRGKAAIVQRRSLAMARAAGRQRYRELEAQLADLLRGSDAAIDAVETQRCQERVLVSASSRVRASAIAAEAAAQAGQQRVESAGHERREVRQSVEEALPESQQDLRVEQTEDLREIAALRREVDIARRSAEELTSENGALEKRLQQYRTSAAADLERAMPLHTPGCWQAVDGPIMKVVTLLVRSTCLRKAFALHLLTTYVWLFFLLFWLEKH